MLDRGAVEARQEREWKLLDSLFDRLETAAGLEGAAAGLWTHARLESVKAAVTELYKRVDRQPAAWMTYCSRYGEREDARG